MSQSNHATPMKMLPIALACARPRKQVSSFPHSTCCPSASTNIGRRSAGAKGTLIAEGHCYAAVMQDTQTGSNSGWQR